VQHFLWKGQVELWCEIDIAVENDTPSTLPVLAPTRCRCRQRSRTHTAIPYLQPSTIAVLVPITIAKLWDRPSSAVLVVVFVVCRGRVVAIG